MDLGGDFNNILYALEKMGGGSWPVRLIIDFRQVLSDIGVTEIPIKGSSFTWLNKPREYGRVLEKLDRFVGSQGWFDLHPSVEAQTLEFFGSDHRVVKLPLFSVPAILSRHGLVSFRYENAWLLEEDYQQVVKDAWSVGGSHSGITNRLEACENMICDWDKNSVGSLVTRIKKVRSRINHILDSEEIECESEEFDRLDEELENQTQEEGFW